MLVFTKIKWGVLGDFRGYWDFLKESKTNTNMNSVVHILLTVVQSIRCYLIGYKL